jgi:ketosteroid isomerase-like protein
MDCTETVRRFLELINDRNVDKLTEMMTEDHRFVDSLGGVVEGREAMRAAWRGYFAFCPDYWVSVEEMLQREDVVAVFGAAGGTIASNGVLLPENAWRVPAAWLARAENGLLSEWRVYADNTPVHAIASRIDSRS